MTLDTYRTTYAWKSSLDLAPHLVRLAEQLPEAEAAGLAGLIRTLSADVPGAIATDLVTGSTTAMPAMLRTIGALEVIERVYPALDTAIVRAAADELATRVAGDNFAEAVEVPGAETAASTDTDPVETFDESESPVPAPPAEPTPLAPAPDPTPATPALASAPAPAPAPQSVPVVPAAPVIYAPSVTEVPSVQPDSPQ